MKTKIGKTLCTLGLASACTAPALHSIDARVYEDKHSFLIPPASALYTAGLSSFVLGALVAGSGRKYDGSRSDYCRQDVPSDGRYKKQ